MMLPPSADDTKDDGAPGTMLEVPPIDVTVLSCVDNRGARMIGAPAVIGALKNDERATGATDEVNIRGT